MLSDWSSRVELHSRLVITLCHAAVASDQADILVKPGILRKQLGGELIEYGRLAMLRAQNLFGPFLPCWCSSASLNISATISSQSKAIKRLESNQ